MMIEIRQAGTLEAETIRSIATLVWWPTYSPILTKEQINYMLDMFYDIDTITQQIQNRQQIYIVLYANNVAKGFAAYSPRPENPDVYKLHKLYCLTETKGKGYGRLLLEHIEKTILDEGKTTLELNVNRHNPALGFYEKMGFTIVYSEDIDIGNGYEMNDYVMRKIIV
jgi:GNAT superfamily N-acetyltransferase